jgi:glycosyltransferase involved in cell wall biosynthesis
LITTDIFPPDSGGPATYTPRIGRELVCRGAEVQVLTYSSSPPSPELAAQDAMHPFPVERIFLQGEHRGRLRRTWASLRRAIAAADLVYVNGLLIETAFANRLIRRPAVAKVVGDIAWERARDKGWIQDDFDTFQGRRYGRGVELRRSLRNWALHQMRAVITPSDYLRRIVAGWGVPAERLHVIYNGHAPVEPLPPLANLALPTRRNLVFVGRLTGWKGVDELIGLLPDLPTDVGLVVVGDGPERARLETLAAQMQVAERVLFTGHVNRTEVAAYLQACDLFVLNSSYEGLPHVVLEALDAGLPVVAAAAGGTPEAIRAGVDGDTVPVGDRAALRAAILTWLDKPHGPIALPARFTERFMLDETVKLLEAVAGAPMAQPGATP